MVTHQLQVRCRPININTELTYWHFNSTSRLAMINAIVRYLGYWHISREPATQSSVASGHTAVEHWCRLQLLQLPSCGAALQWLYCACGKQHNRQLISVHGRFCKSLQLQQLLLWTGSSDLFISHVCVCVCVCTCGKRVTWRSMWLPCRS